MTQTLNNTGKQIRFQFLSVLSHELKAPLNAIDGYLKMIKERQFGNSIDAYDEMLDRSMERIKGMRQLILDLLDLTKIETGKPTQKLEIVNIRKIVQMAVDTIRPYSIQKDVDLYINTRENIEMKADPGEIEIVLNNLVSNAVKYNKPGGRVDIFLEKKEGKLVITVSDTGIGLKLEDKEKIFDDFVRIKSSQTREVTGSGLGLSIVKKIVDMYHGGIEVQSEPGKGSTFIITLMEPE
jgi:signal transduction histidine kinase